MLSRESDWLHDFTDFIDGAHEGLCIFATEEYGPKMVYIAD